MKAVHFTYWITHKRTRYLADIRPLLDAYLDKASDDFRKSLTTDSGDKLLLYPAGTGSFLFVVTKDDEMIKFIDSTTRRQENIMKRIGTAGHVAFASYVHVGRHSFSMASTFHGPKHTRWESFVNQLLERTGWTKYGFYASPIEENTTAGRAMKFSVKHKIRVKLKPGFSLSQEVSSFFGNDPETADIEVILRPRRKSQLAVAWREALSHVSDPAVSRIIVSGKENMDDLLSDFYVVGSGRAFDVIDKTTESGIIAQLSGIASRSVLIRDAVAENMKDNRFTDDPLPGNPDLGDTSRWNRALLA